MATNYKAIIGRAESIDFIGSDTEYLSIAAKVDTGAYSSSVWASNIVEQDGELSFELLGKGHEAYTGETIRMSKYSVVTIENSFGKSEKRYGVMLRVRFCGKKVSTFFTLSDRSKKIYPVLVGRKLLKGRFVVDVSGGHPVADEETEENLGYNGLKNRARKQTNHK
ncbi:MAG TPA: RimK/LysX family protein [Patescibacteria group bacterium]|jgi:hypothetical protein|nr:RimK/LysX family protein [Patescibacteria group bacterium]